LKLKTSFGYELSRLFTSDWKKIQQRPPVRSLKALSDPIV